ncbi:MAG: NAD-dependent DNA ligase LigA [Clostridiaceae bacterium]|nr:NAD-dependent DNA ligase LigA [Clostridiaceae bacterium]
MSDQKLERIKELVGMLSEAARVYYQGQDEIMSNFEYDRLYDELSALEQETGVVLAGSPTQRVGYEVLGELPKERHAVPMLSLDKTKEVDQLAAWLGDQDALLSWKMDGLTVVLTYVNGRLQKAVTRGNGQIGEVITGNARVFKNIPLAIPHSGEVVLRGEAVIPYSEFRRINARLPEQEQYKNPRNLCSGSVRQLNNKITAERNVHFFAFALVSAENVDFHNSQEEKFRFLAEQGFELVEYRRVNKNTIADAVQDFSKKVSDNDFPSDGLVLLLNDIAYGDSLGTTAKFPRNAIAFKWADEIAETTLLEVEWSASRTGLINPVAVFEPVELEGTTVSRASVHNVSIVKELELGIGDKIEVYKANMIIPQIAENLTRSGALEIAKYCPVCNEPASIHSENGVEVLFCENKNCLAKKMKTLAHFVSRDALNIEGLSEATIEKLMEKGLLHQMADLFRLGQYREEIVGMEGFGEKSYTNLIDAVNRAREVTVSRFLYSLGIPGIGPANAKLICKAFEQDFARVRCAAEEELLQIDGVGPVLAAGFRQFFDDPANRGMVDALLGEITLLQEQQSAGENTMQGLVFVITGTLTRFANRKELKELLESHGAKVTGSVTGNTDYLINNDSMSSSSKNKKAKELAVPILTEQQLLDKFRL